ncbi:SPOR domain-containing protein [Desulfovibrio oxyclinae]|uniref:SPOR domain-containing protein n=1 Tax=Desulfovibrio oxyclinae TaxID=63560 RepID=UPI0003759C31|nr:SPOR domain-containing protein [Desulfovibrio oxyclinae]
MAANGRKASKQTPRMPKVPKEPKVWNLRLTVPGLICGIGISGLALTLFFILGLLVGRGYRVEEKVPRLAAMMPEQPVAVSEHGAKADNDGDREVLKPEDLSYPENLSKAPAKPKPKKPEKPEPSEKKVEEKAEKKAAEKSEPAQQEKNAAVTAGENVYDYVYQAASFRDRDMAMKLAAKINKAQLVSRVEAFETSSGNWYRVMVLHRGTPESTESMKSVLEKFGISKPLMKQKKPVAADG